MFKTATKTQSRLRMALIGPAGSGKTYTALKLASELGGRVAVIDTERGSASKYSDEFKFDVAELESFAPSTYTDAIESAEDGGYDVLIIDSLSHAWAGKDGALEQVDNAAKRSQSSNTYTAWRNVTPQHNRMIDTILQSKCHVIWTLRTKTEYVIEENEKGKKVPRKVGLAPIQREGSEYEADIVADLTPDHDLLISKTRCRDLDGKVFNKPGKELASIVRNWISDGEPMVEKPKAVTAPEDNTADYLATLYRTNEMLGFTAAHLDKYLSSKWYGGRKIDSDFRLSGEQFDKSMVDLSAIGEESKTLKASDLAAGELKEQMKKLWQEASQS